MYCSLAVLIILCILGVLVRSSIIDKDTRISFILGTGSNASYFEKSECLTNCEVEEKEVGFMF